jgi:uncharacterized protein (DUF1697 family)
VPRYLALLRAVNVGGKNSVPMPALREAVEGLGYTDVSTYIQSGNVLFSAPRAVKPHVLEAEITQRFGLEITVMLRTAREVAKVLGSNPFAGEPTDKLHIGFMADKPPATIVRAIDTSGFAPELFTVVGREYWLFLPNGMGRTKLAPFVTRRLGVPATVRTLKTVTKLADLLGA